MKLGDYALGFQYEEDVQTLAHTAPMPVDPMECRWCHGRLIELNDTARTKYCQGGCSANHLARTAFECERCLRMFESGRKDALWCLECEAVERRDVRVIRSTTPRIELNPKGYITRVD